VSLWARRTFRTAALPCIWLFSAVMIKETFKSCAFCQLKNVECGKNFTYFRDIVQRYCSVSPPPHPQCLMESAPLAVCNTTASSHVNSTHSRRYFMFWMLIICRGPKILYPQYAKCCRGHIPVSPAALTPILTLWNPNNSTWVTAH